MLVEHYTEIFPVDLHWSNYDEGIKDILEEVRQIKTSEEVNRLSQDFANHRSSIEDQQKPAKNSNLFGALGDRFRKS